MTRVHSSFSALAEWEHYPCALGSRKFAISASRRRAADFVSASKRTVACNEMNYSRDLRSVEWGFRGQLRRRRPPVLVLHMSMHYHSPLATILGPVHDGNDH